MGEKMHSARRLPMNCMDDSDFYAYRLADGLALEAVPQIEIGDHLQI
jgi:hypothetical protein